MVKKSDGTLVQALAISSGGAHGGGWVTGIRGAADGWLVSRNDTTVPHIRGPNASRWSVALQFGVNVPVSEFIHHVGPTCYDIDICRNDSTRVVMVDYGRIYTSSDRCATLTKVTAFKSGAFDSTFSYYPHNNARIGGAHVRIDPVNANRWAAGHPVDGGYITGDNGATIAIPSTLPAPINATNERRGVHFAFDESTASGGSTQTVYCMIAGRGVYRSTTGLLSNSWTFMTGGPIYCTSMEAAGGKLYVCGTGDPNPSQLYVLSGTTWTQPSGVSGMAIAIKAGDPTKIIVMTDGGDNSYSADSGGTWTTFSQSTTTTATDCPWLANTTLGYTSTGAIFWEARTGVNRLLLACGIGILELSNPPRSSGNAVYNSVSLGIKQMLMKSATVTPKGTLFCVGEDRPIWRFERGQATKEATGHGPNYNYAIRHGGDIDYAAADENFVVATYTQGNAGAGSPSFAVSTDNGKNWVEPGTAPTDGGIKIQAGNVAVTGVGKFIWCPTFERGMRFTLDSGQTWGTPVFRDAPGGNILDMSQVIWHADYTMRRKILVSDKSTDGHAFAYASGYARGDRNNTVAAKLGWFETTDHGANWVRIRSTAWVSSSVDFYAAKARLVPGFAGHMFWVSGNVGGYPDAPSADQLIYFSTDKGVTYAGVSGFQEAEDIAFSLRPSNRVYPRLNVKGWRTVGGTLTYGIWTCDDFNPSSPSAATWTLLTNGPEGRMEQDTGLAGDPNAYPGLYIIQASGGFYTYDDPVKIRAS